MKKTSSKLFVVPYMLWIALFVLASLVLIFGQSFFNIEGQFSLENYKSYFASQNLTYLKPKSFIPLSTRCNLQNP
ncbi:spermidine/putrescine ABC transporter permease [Streptococcus pneumoniae]|uniref:Spermidine/putrescine ABC transporter permease n=1 Tax=Streptococcus pneumoniae TaxID=1313 RepID=A0AA87CC30_STREE|nr:spermidine/putrescine ABC transporter permease [Streptococcus pneumoniae]CIS83628.1 spermidine/putrescine ABC transporter permease [Streptococcus pneumoniae]CIZ17045.1 spermidine/putrescine ABC transporter permease [Streptococcus pneumoniae]CJV09631.1 spermidine/putrescine ABC transporter permease [Streptococcus pneumoniae]CJX05589.1 spermidine/putrescine ABC transporter permease [Streptococcus pneumoniae]